MVSKGKNSEKKSDLTGWHLPQTPARYLRENDPKPRNAGPDRYKTTPHHQPSELAANCNSLTTIFHARESFEHAPICTVRVIIINMFRAPTTSRLKAENLRVIAPAAISNDGSFDLHAPTRKNVSGNS